MFRTGIATETDSKLVVFSDWKKGSDCLTGMGFPFGVMEKFWN